ncbi:MFS transporter [Actinomadura sp. KC345]|uniref:MFS transporter n=1 Tax=Actinomadura sp. KC345 TaxID=2530371 RepID=UPI0010456058|nr:MFS transporter [Actinomadura sp. KC345]TDC57494.1 MFS transporter [Actinomadura sp. KC345]
MDTSEGAKAGTGRAGAREWAGLAVVALLILVVSADLNVLHLAVPKLSADLRPGAAQLLWITDVYGFVIAGFLITMGTLGDRIGRRRLLLWGAAAFGAASVLAALAPSAELLIAARALLGVAGAMVLPSALSLIRAAFHDPGQRKIAIAVWITAFSVGSALGPLLGGVLLQHFWWGSVFLPGVAAIVPLLATGPALLPEYRDPAGGRLDLPSAALSLGAVLAVVYGLKQIAEYGAGSAAVAAVLAGVTVGAVFLRRQVRLADPLIDVRLFAGRVFSGALAAQALGVFVMGGTFFLVAQYLQLVLALSPLEAALWLVPTALALVAGSMTAPLLAQRIRPAHVMGGGLLLAAGGFAVLSLADGSGLAHVVAGFVIVGLGLSPVVALSTDMIVAAAPPERAGSASGISESGNELGQALGIAVLGGAGTAVYRGRVESSLPAGVPAESARAAQDTLGAAVSVAEGLPARLSTQLADVSRAAFTDGLQVVALVCAAIAAALALLTVMLLRAVPPGAGQSPERTEEPSEKAPAGPAMRSVSGDLPDVMRDDAGAVLVGEPASGDTAVGDELRERTPGLLSLSRFVSADGESVLLYAQTTGDERAAGRLRSRGVECTEYVLYRSHAPETSRVPGCVVAVSVETRDAAVARQWSDAVIAALESEGHTGGLSAHLHISTDGTRVLNYAEWADEQAHRAAMDDTHPGSPQWRLVQEMPGVKPLGFRRYRLDRTVQ